MKLHTTLLPLLLASSIVGCAGTPHDTTIAAVPMAGDARGLAVDFVSLDAAGREVRLSDFAGKVVVLDFWATWCVPCVKSMPHTQETAARYAKEGVVVLAVCTSDTREKYSAWVEKNAAKYPNILFTCDPNDRGSDTFEERASSKHFGVSGIPAQFVIGRDRKIVGQLTGYEGESDARAEAFLAQAGVRVDDAVVAKGRDQLRKEAEDEARRAAAEAANPPPSFTPRLGQLESGAPMPDVTLVDAEGKPYALSSLRGKTLVLGFGWDEVVPVKWLQAIGEKHGSNGVLPIATFVYTAREGYDAWLTKSKGKYTFACGWDPAGKYVGDAEKPNMDALAAWNATTVVRKIMGGDPMGSTPAMPIFVVVDANGGFVGVCWAGPRHEEGLGNLLLRAGVKLAAADMPKSVAPAEAFVVKKEAPRPPEAKVELLAIGSSAPDFVTQDVDGKGVRLSDYKGKVVVLDFWATWCGPCIASMPHTQEVAESYKDQGVVVIGQCTSDSRASFEAWVLKNRGRYPDFVFTHDAAEKKPERVSRRLFGVSGIPAQFVLDREGKVVAFVSGYRSGEVLLEGALAKAGVKVDPAVLEKAIADQKARDAK